MPDKNKIRQLGEVYILLRMSCELKCKICPYWGGSGACNSFSFKKKYIQDERNLISVENVKNFVDQISRYKPKMITLSGGEPLMFKGWIEIARHIKSKDIKVSLSTNGLHIKKFTGPILEYVDSIQLNLGGTKEIISKTRGAEYGFDEVIENIRAIAELKKKKKQNTPFVRIIYVVSDLSYRHISERIILEWMIFIFSILCMRIERC
jgi:MoaA/NifB/PqqE/SkfB family radical SAM enzyme